MRIIDYEEIKSRVTLEGVVEPVREAFAVYSRGGANIPPVQHLEMPECGNSALHIKSGHVAPMPFCLVKVASTFPNNPSRKPPQPSIGGAIVVFSTDNGAPIAVLEDRAWITQIRTAGAGAVAADLFARRDAATLGVIGSGVQARLQTDAAIHSRPGLSRVLVWGRTRANVASYCIDTSRRHPGMQVIAMDSAEAVAMAADILVTATYSQEPIVRAEWLRDGVLVIAMGADSVYKQELCESAIASADTVVVDSRPQNQTLGEIGRGIRLGRLSASRMDREIGEVVLGAKAASGSGRKSPKEKIIVKLTGVAVQEIMVCAALLQQMGIDMERPI